VGRAVSRFARADVVVVPFPFSDLSTSKRRPTLVIAPSGPDDFILCQITSRPVRDGLEVPIEQADFREGSLNQPSNARPNRLFTADGRIILYKAGSLTEAAMRRSPTGWSPSCGEKPESSRASVPSPGHRPVPSSPAPGAHDRCRAVGR
jgi:mRNA interferase MazF